MSPDPLGGDTLNPQSLNRYSYVLNNPEGLVDPLGLCPQGQVKVNGSCVTPSTTVTVTAQPVCYGPPEISDPFAGFWGYVPYYSETACLLMEDQMGAGGAALFNTPASNPGLPAIAHTYGGRPLPNGPRTQARSPQTHPPQDQNGRWPPAPREGTYGEFLACEANDVLSDPDKLEVEGAVTVAPIPLAATGQEAKAWVGLGLAAVLDWGSAISTNVKCEREVNYHPSW